MTVFSMMWFCFNPRPRAGGDSQGSLRRLGQFRFQSTPPRGGRLKYAELLQVQNVSIHAPARGATGVVGQIEQYLQSFNPRPRAGGDIVSRLLSGP